MKVYSYTPQSVYTVQNGAKIVGQSYLKKKLTVRFKKTSAKNKVKAIKKTIFVIDRKSFKQYRKDIKTENRNISVIGQTKLRQFSNNASRNNKKFSDTDAILEISGGEGLVGYFEIRERYAFSRVVGYLPVGNDQFLAVVSFSQIVPLFVLVALLSIIVGMSILLLPNESPDKPSIDRYVEDIDTSDVNTNSSNTRYKLNTTMTVINGTIQNLNLENVNEGKYLRLKIKLDHEHDADYIYDSGLISFGKKVTADTLLRADVPAGTYRTIAECYVYATETEQVAQTNFEITLIVK